MRAGCCKITTFFQNNLRACLVIGEFSLLLWKFGIKMPGELKQTIERVSNKAKILVERYHVLLESKRQADARILEQDAMILAQKKEIESLRQQVEYLQIATNVIPDNSQTERTPDIDFDFSAGNRPLHQRSNTMMQ